MAAEYFRRLGSGWGFLAPFLEDGQDRTLVRLLKESGVLEMPEISAMLRNTVSLNMVHAGEQTNVIPDRAEAHIDARLLPGQDADAFVAAVRKRLADDDILVETVTAFPSTLSPSDSPEPFFQTAIMSPSLT